MFSHVWHHFPPLHNTQYDHGGACLHWGGAHTQCVRCVFSERWKLSWLLCSDTFVYILYVPFDLTRQFCRLPSSVLPVLCELVCFETSETDHLLCCCKYFRPPLSARSLFFLFCRPELWFCTSVTGNCICWQSEHGLLSRRHVKEDISKKAAGSRAAIHKRKEELFKRFLLVLSVLNSIQKHQTRQGHIHTCSVQLHIHICGHI